MSFLTHPPPITILKIANTHGKYIAYKYIA